MILAATETGSSAILLWGSLSFGALIGWYIYFINRHRTSQVQLSDLVTVIGVIGGAAVLKLFPASTDMFGAYGIGLAVGFFGYFVALLIKVAITPNFTVDWFLDGRSKLPEPPWGYSGEGGRPMLQDDPDALRD